MDELHAGIEFLLAVFRGGDISPASRMIVQRSTAEA